MIKPFIDSAVEENCYSATIKCCLKFADRSVVSPNLPTTNPLGKKDMLDLQNNCTNTKCYQIFHLDSIAGNGETVIFLSRIFFCHSRLFPVLVISISSALGF